MTRAKPELEQVAKFTCPSCGLEKKVPDKFIGKKVKCPDCKASGQVVAEAAEGVDQDKGVFACPKCGFSKEVPLSLVGKKAKCPQCETQVVISPPGKVSAPGMDLGETLDDTDLPEPEDEEPKAPTAVLTRESLAKEDQDPKEKSLPLMQGSLPGNLFSGLVVALSGLFFALAYASLIFSTQALGTDFSRAAHMALITAVVGCLVYAFRGRIEFAVAGPESTATAVLYLMALSMASGMSAEYPAEVVSATTVAAVAIAAFATGAVLLFTGRIKSAAWVRSIPYHAIGGVAAAIGLVIVRGAYHMALNQSQCWQALWEMPSLNFGGLFDWFRSDMCLGFLPALLFGLVLFFALMRKKNIFVALILLLAAVGFAHFSYWWGGYTLEEAAAKGWVFTHGQGMFKEVYEFSFLKSIRWGVILENAAFMAAIVGVIIATVMLKITNIEIKSRREIDLDRVYRNLGGMNMISALVGGMPGSLSQGRSLGARAAGATGPVANLFAALLLAAALFFSDRLLPFIPRFVPAGILVFVGLSLMKRWLADSRSEMSRPGEFFMLWLIFLLTAVFGLLLGLGIGIALAMMLMVSRYGRASVVKHMLSGANHRSNVDRAPSQLKVLKTEGDRIFILRLQGFIFLGTTDKIAQLIHARLQAAERLPVVFILLDFTFVSGLDSTVAISFTKLKQLAEEHDITLIFTSVPFDVEQELEEGGFILNAPDGTSLSFVDLDHAMEWCEDRVLEAENALSVKEQTLPQLLKDVFPRPEYLPRLMKHLRKVTVDKDQHVFRQGDPSDAMYFIRSGTVNIELELEGNKILRLKKMAPGTVFGEMGIYTTAPRSASVKAAEPCELYRLSVDDLETIQAKDPQLGVAIHHFIVNLLAGRVFEANAKVRDLLQ